MKQPEPCESRRTNPSTQMNSLPCIMKWEKNTVHDVRCNKTDITTVKNSRSEGEKVRTNWILQGWQTWTNSHHHSSIPSSTTGCFLEEKQKSHGRAPDDSMFSYHFIGPSEPRRTEQWKCVSQRGINPPLVSFLFKDRHQPTSRVTAWTRKQASSCFSGQFKLRKSITERQQAQHYFQNVSDMH